jgi:hypothetical protein
MKGKLAVLTVVALVGLGLSAMPVSAKTVPHTVHTAVAQPASCSEMVDNGGHGLAIVDEGAGNAVEMTGDGSGDCFTPVNSYVDESQGGVTYWEYKDGEGDCLDVDHTNIPGLIVTTTCTPKDPYELLVGYQQTVDSSGYNGWNLECLADVSYCNGSTQVNFLCSDDSLSGSLVSTNSGISGQADRCVWQVP